MEKLKKNKCPVKGCNENLLTKQENGTVKCNKCGGVWEFVCWAPMDSSWVEIVKPKGVYE